MGRMSLLNVGLGFGPTSSPVTCDQILCGGTKNEFTAGPNRYDIDAKDTPKDEEESERALRLDEVGDVNGSRDICRVFRRR
jgi:hypothetical protein